MTGEGVGEAVTLSVAVAVKGGVVAMGVYVDVGEGGRKAGK